MEEELAEGQEIPVMIREFDSQGRVNLSRKPYLATTAPRAPRPDSGPLETGGFWGGHDRVDEGRGTW
ncbi:MAG: hypothetical protein Ct9H300mP11_27110 [Chloroflexota bacterium]|nr:MAG: hypothetical protein Ct9H300mP11_27110 [Chloroflexota bacterium]